MFDYSYMAALFLLLILISVYLAPKIKKILYRIKLYKSGLDNIDNGYDFEDYIVSLLRRNGFRKVRTTPKSGDYGADIIAEKDGEMYAVQCKLYGKSVGVKAVQEVFSAMQYYNCHAAVVATNSRFSRNAMNLADSTGTILWDRDVLVDMAAGKAGKTNRASKK